jgi:hypothetical protein
MTKRIYWSDIIVCEDLLFENLDALVAVATETPVVFLGSWHTDNILVSAEIRDGLELTWTELDCDENDNDIRVLKTESFTYSVSTEMAVLVGND